MSTSTDAILFYGFCWDEEDENGVPEDEWPERLLARRGQPNPWDSYPEDAHKSLPDGRRRAAEKEWAAAHRAELDAWYASRDAAEEEFAADIDWHCSEASPMAFVFIKASRLTANRGHPEEVAPALLTVASNWDAELERFLSELGIAKPDGQDTPRWWLVSYRG